MPLRSRLGPRRAPADARRGPTLRLVLALLCALTVAGCAATVTGSPAGTTAAGLRTAPSPSASAPASSGAAPSTPVSTPATATSSHSSAPASLPHPPSSTTRSTAAAAPVVPAGAPVIVLDPGHSPTVHGIDPGTGLDVSDYENEPEMQDVFAVAQLAAAQLRAAGYRVVLTKTSATQPTTLGQRDAIANAAHAALAVSIHDQAGSSGGIGFDSGNNTVYYPTVGDYRETPSGSKVYFTDSQLAARDRSYGQIFQAQRARVEGHPVTLLGNTGYDLGSRGLAPGNIWIVQLLSRVPWIYDEAGGNSAGQSGLNAADRQRYANGIVAGVEHCLPR